jgi:hypothetical protein
VFYRDFSALPNIEDVAEVERDGSVCGSQIGDGVDMDDFEDEENDTPQQSSMLTRQVGQVDNEDMYIDDFEEKENETPQQRSPMLTSHVGQVDNEDMYIDDFEDNENETPPPRQSSRLVAQVANKNLVSDATDCEDVLDADEPKVMNRSQDDDDDEDFSPDSDATVSSSEPSVETEVLRCKNIKNRQTADFTHHHAPIKRRRWSPAELAILFKEFGMHITSKRMPDGKSLARAVQLLGGTRTVSQIRTQVNNYIKGKLNM